jgi:hypothetical protein
MKLPSKADLQKKNDRELARLTEEIRRHIADCEEQRRKGCGALEDIRRVQAQRRIKPYL